MKLKGFHQNRIDDIENLGSDLFWTCYAGTGIVKGFEVALT
jgi:hypothetical protein